MILADGYLRVARLPIAPVPHLPDTPFWDQPWIDPDLYAVAFGSLDEHTPNTYMIMDAVLRKRTVGQFDLDAIDLPVQSLFNGQAEIDYAETAPYLLDLTLPEAGPTRFHRTFFAQQWDSGMGVLVRSSANFADVRKHFRRFTRAVNADGRPMFFRFWETNVMRDYFACLAQEKPERACDFFRLQDDTWIDMIVGHADGLDATFKVTPQIEALRSVARSTGPIVLDPVEEKALYLGVLRKYAKAIEQEIVDPKTLRDPMERENLVFGCVLRMRDAGFQQIDHLRTLAHWDLTANGPFEKANAELGRIVAMALPESDKMKHLRAAYAPHGPSS